MLKNLNIYILKYIMLKLKVYLKFWTFENGKIMISFF